MSLAFHAVIRRRCFLACLPTPLSSRFFFRRRAMASSLRGLAPNEYIDITILMRLCAKVRAASGSAARCCRHARSTVRAFLQARFARLCHGARYDAALMILQRAAHAYGKARQMRVARSTAARCHSACYSAARCCTEAPMLRIIRAEHDRFSRAPCLK